MNDELFLPTEFCATDHLRQQTAHDGFERTAVIRAHPFRELEQRFAQCWSFAHQCFNWSDALCVAVVEHSQDRGKRGFIAKWDAHARSDPDAFGQRFWHRVIELALNGAV